MANDSWKMWRPLIYTRSIDRTGEKNSKYLPTGGKIILILSRCVPPDISEETLLLGGEYNDFLRRALFNIKPVNLIAESKYSALDNFVRTRYSYNYYLNYRFIHFLRKAHRFILVTSSQSHLRSILQRTKDSPWANADGFYILIDRQTAKRGCINARSYLWTAWEYDLLSVVFICIDPDDGIVHYTFNPFSSHMTKNWHEVDRLKGRYDHPWIMFKKTFVRDDDMCKDLDFDKVANLNGYVIRLNAVSMAPFLKINPTKEGLDKFSGENAEVIKTLFRKLKASPYIDIYNGTTYDLGGIKPNGTLFGMLTSVGDGQVDMGMNTRSLLVLWKFRYTYPHTRSGLCVISQPNQQISEFTKLMTFLKPPVMAGVFVICLLTYAIFTWNEGYGEAALELLRLLICVAILHPPRINSVRIFLCTVFILFLNVNSLFQSRWSSLLTVPVFYSTVDSLDSIKKHEYKIYGPDILKDFLSDNVLQSRYVAVSNNHVCKHFVKNSTDAVCAGDCYHLYYRIRNDDLYKSKNLRDMTLAYVTRENWPLFRPVNNAIQQMVQCGLIGKFRRDGLRKIKRERMRRRTKTKKSYNVMLLSQLAFSFYILGIGYTCATIVFAVELLLGTPVESYHFHVKISMTLARWKFILFSTVVKYSYQSLTYAPAKLTEKDIMLGRLDTILSNCLADEMNYIGLLGDAEIPGSWSSGFMKTTPTIRLRIPVASLDKPFYSWSTHHDCSARYDKLHAFVLFISSPSSLRRVVERLMGSVWWNPWAFHAIIHTRENTCRQPEAYLSAAWNSDLESSVFFCVDPDEGHVAYTYNRYGNPAPRIWYTVESSVDEENRTWDVLKHKLQSTDSTACEDLHFNKKIKVGGYGIKLVGVISPPNLSFDPQKKGLAKYGGLNGFILNTLITKMNATMSVRMLDNKTRIHTLLRNVTANEYDMLMNAQYIFDKRNYTMTYPHVDSGISTLSRPSGFDSNEMKILKFMNPRLIAGILLASILTVLVLGILAGLGLSSACLEVVRIMVNSSVLRFPQRAPLRIYLITVILLFLITGSTFQSSLSSILTSSTSKPDIDSNTALKRAGYPIYAFAGYRDAIPDPVLRLRVRETDRRDCSGYVIEYPDTVCVADRSRLMRIAFKNELHISKHRITNLYMGYVTRPNFPLAMRIGRVLMSMSQGGLISHWQERTVAVYKNRWAMKAYEMKTKRYRTMNTSDLLFAFYVLFLGLGVSVVMFLAELSVVLWRR
ncbi:PREDICTED: uncharacterized protein LOC106749684 [Dinoponera quadriceps]|uniref:Uncharacterized protein LOC106749684 n=1 Tax=Dinoponera quadriceps TaxID=609295 RepID=A0A6P3Y3K8_DINQU|nr:PREDICTED: uncharacterized protein LOC106749684 [Dinoponera quadriceps]